MAFFDFLSRDIGGYSGAVQAPQTGMTGITYGDLGKAALMYGSKPGSSGPMIAGLPDFAGNQPYAPFGTPKTEQEWAAGAGMGQVEGQAGPPQAGQYRPPMTAAQLARMRAPSPGMENRPRSSGQILSGLLPFLFGAPGG